MGDDVGVSAAPVPYELPDERVSDAWARLVGEYLVAEGLEPGFAHRIRAAARSGSLSSAPLSDRSVSSCDLTASGAWLSI